MQVEPTDLTDSEPKPHKKKTPPGSGLKVGAFMDLMARLAVIKEQLSNEQVRFIQNAIQRFEHETEGFVKTKHALPKPKKQKKTTQPSMPVEPRPPSNAAHGFLERMVKMPSEDEVVAAVRHLSGAEADRLAREQGLRANSPDVAREKLIEMIMTLRDIERIAGAGKPPVPDIKPETPT
jgi:hypothetical protein